MRGVETSDPPPPTQSNSDRTTSTRAPAATLAVLVVAAFPLILFRLGSPRWFFQDEWDFLVTRRASSLHDLLRPHNEHWSTLPVLVYRGLYAILGLHSYYPYQAVVVALHLTAVVLVWVVMGRSGVRPWIATATAATLILFGSGQEDIVWAFQMGFVGSLVFGLIQLLLVDHDGDWDRRDWLGLAAGAAALMCSGIGVTMVVVVGVACLIQRGWRVAAAQTLPLALLYLVWFEAESPGAGSDPTHRGLPYIVGQIAHFDLDGIAATFRGIGYLPIVGIGLAIVLVAGIAVAARDEGHAALLHRAAGPAALLVGAIVLFTINGVGRWQHGPAYASQSRYLYLAAAMVLPAVAVGIDALGRRTWIAVAVGLGLLAIGIPGNVAMFDNGKFAGPSFDTQRQLMLSLPRSPLARQVPQSVRPDPFTSLPVTIGWLRQQQQAGKLADPGSVPRSVSSQIPLRLGVHLALFPVTPKDCTPTSVPVLLTPAEGSTLVLDGHEANFSVEDHGTWSPPVKYNVAVAHLYLIELAGLHLRLAPAKRHQPLLICH
jgi:hypothetical protein